MGLTAEQLQMAGLIDTRVKAIAKSGVVDDLAIFTDMADYLPAFKRLMDTSTADDMDQLAARYTGFYQYAKILEAVAAGIRSGKIVVPKQGPPGDLTWTSDLASNDAYDIMLLIYEGILTPILMGEDSLLERVTAAAEDA